MNSELSKVFKLGHYCQSRISSTSHCIKFEFGNDLIKLLLQLLFPLSCYLHTEFVVVANNYMLVSLEAINIHQDSCLVTVSIHKNRTIIKVIITLTCLYNRVEAAAFFILHFKSAARGERLHQKSQFT